MHTIRDIAKEAKVSVATVSRYLDPEKKRLVHSETQTVLEAVIQKYRYVPNRSARALSRRTTNTVGMVTSFSTDVVKSNYYQALIAGVIEGMRSTSYDLKWVMIREEETDRTNADELLQKHSVDGMIILSWRILPRLVREIEHRTKLPMVLINDFEPYIRSSIVYCDNKSGIQSVYAYLVSKGYRKIGMIRGPEYISLDAVERFKAFTACAKAHRHKQHLKFSAECVRFDEQTAYETMRSWIPNHELPQAFVCANDDLALGTIRALREHKIQVPKDVAVAGFDDSTKSEFFHPALTSVRQPLEEMGRSAIETLVKLMTKKVSQPIQLKFKPELILRESA